MTSDITIILDRSGSMATIAPDVVGGLNAFIESQRAVEGEAHLTLVQFDDEYEVVHWRAPIREVPLLTMATYSPRGSTALLDAIGRTLADLSTRLDALPSAERPERVIVVVQTDGQENASREWSRRKVFELLRLCERERKWELVFLAANQDAIAEGRSMGFAASQALDFEAQGNAVAAMFSIVADKVSAARRDPEASIAFSAEDRALTSKK